ncbi:MAG: hypothetical protein HY673_02540 [Chloroflexi bacterium]|nr:hypothetical protein [Chloroflexota bacterium]
MSTSQSQASPGRLLRVDLTAGKVSAERVDERTLRKYVGGATLGVRLLLDEVPPGVEWSDPGNHLFLGSGPLGGTKVGGSGAVAVVTKGALTGGIASTQANGFFGAFLRFCGFDGIVVQGASPDWVYLHIQDGTVEMKNAAHLVGKNNFEVNDLLRRDLGKKERQASILSIGPAGENLVRFASIFVDLGHIAAHNGVGAVMGSKKLKAIIVDRGKRTVPLQDRESLSQTAKEIEANTMANKVYAEMASVGTLGGMITMTKVGIIPVKNYTTSIFAIPPDKLSTYSPEYIRRQFRARPSPCWACPARHCHTMQIPEGKYAGRVVEEPEYEALAAFSSLVGIDAVTTTMVLTNEVDRLGMDANEMGWVIAWLMECTEKGILTSQDTDGLEMTWGNGEAIMAMMDRIARRQGFGDVLAEGVMRAARRVGGEATALAVHTEKGNSPRGHDHRVKWLELFDTCVSSMGTLEVHSFAPYALLGMPPVFDDFDPQQVSAVEARIKGAMLFEDSMVTCRFRTATALDLLCKAVNSAAGWDMDVNEAMVVGRRAANMARVFNLRHGIGPELDRPSMRYGSTPLDGAAAGRAIMPHWDAMLANYYHLMGWDKKGRPLEKTLSDLGLADIVPYLAAIQSQDRGS